MDLIVPVPCSAPGMLKGLGTLAGSLAEKASDRVAAVAAVADQILGDEDVTVTLAFRLPTLEGRPLD